MAAFSTIALASGLALAAAGTGYSAVAGVQAEKSQRNARYRSREAQADALRIQMVERTRSVQKEMEADRPTPASTIAVDEENALATDRTGGVSERLKLSRRSALGGGL